MKTKILSVGLLTTAFILNNFSFAQQQKQNNPNETKFKPFVISSVFLTHDFSAFTLDNNPNILFNNFIQGSAMQQQIHEDSKYTWFSPFIYVPKTSMVSLSFHSFDSKNNSFNDRREFRLGLGYSRSTMSASICPRISSDGTNYIGTNISYYGTSNYVNVEASYLFKTDPQKRFSFYAGTGLSLGISTNNTLTRYYSRDSLNYISNGTGFEITDSDLSEISCPAQGSYYVSAFVPLEVNWRLAKTKPVISNFSVFATGKIGIDYTCYKDAWLRSSVKTTVGIRYNLANKN
jgi:hypothetical protein